MVPTSGGKAEYQEDRRKEAEVMPVTSYFPDRFWKIIRDSKDVSSEERTDVVQWILVQGIRVRSRQADVTRRGIRSIFSDRVDESFEKVSYALLNAGEQCYSKLRISTEFAEVETKHALKYLSHQNLLKQKVISCPEWMPEKTASKGRVSAIFTCDAMWIAP